MRTVAIGLLGCLFSVSSTFAATDADFDFQYPMTQQWGTNKIANSPRAILWSLTRSGTLTYDNSRMGVRTQFDQFASSDRYTMMMLPGNGQGVAVRRLSDGKTIQCLADQYGNHIPGDTCDKFRVPGPVFDPTSDAQYSNFYPMRKHSPGDMQYVLSSSGILTLEPGSYAQGQGAKTATFPIPRLPSTDHYRLRLPASNELPGGAFRVSIQRQSDGQEILCDADMLGNMKNSVCSYGSPLWRTPDEPSQ
jgi:hypothetical protein